MGLFDFFRKKPGESSPPPSAPRSSSPPPSLAPPPAQIASSHQVGDRVLARWFDSFFYPGRIQSIRQDRCEIAYDDGDRAWVHIANVHRPEIAVGSRVFMPPGGVTAEVRQSNGEKLRVRFDDGREEWTTLSRVRVQRPIVDVGDDPHPVGAPAQPMSGAITSAAPMPGMQPGSMMPAGFPQVPPPAILDVGEPVEDVNWRSGDRVLARWWDLFWYPGSILAVGTKGFHILFDDGDQRIVGDLGLMPLAIEEGEEIFLRKKNQPQRIYTQGRVTRVKGELLDADLEDGETETNQRVSRARFWRCPVGIANFAFEEGDRILGCDVDGFTYPAEILSIDGDKIIVQFLDGPERMLTPELVRRFDLGIGSRIECRWKGGPQYFAGKITHADSDRIHIDYDDGDKEWTTMRLVRMPPKPQAG